MVITSLKTILPQMYRKIKVISITIEFLVNRKSRAKKNKNKRIIFEIS